MKIMRHIPFCICMLFLAACIMACGVERPKGILSDKEMEEVLYDYHAAKVLGDNEPSSQKYKTTIYYMSVFRKHNITEEQFDSTLAWYSKNPETFNKVYQKVIKRIQDEKGALERSIAISGKGRSSTMKGDSVNIWNGVPMFTLTGLPYDNRVTFHFENDLNFEDNDTLKLNARIRYLNATTQRIRAEEAAVISLSLRYRNDSVISRLQKVTTDRKQTFTLYANSLGRIREVYGFIYFPKQKDNRIMLADSVSLIRLHAKEQ